MGHSFVVEDACVESECLAGGVRLCSAAKIVEVSLKLFGRIGHNPNSKSKLCNSQHVGSFSQKVIEHMHIIRVENI